MPRHEEFPSKGVEGVPSDDIGWHFGTPVPNTRENILCKLCDKVVKGEITRFKEHIAYKTGNVAPCPKVTDIATRQVVRDSIQSQHEWHRRQEFRQRTSGWSNIMKKDEALMVQSKSSRQPKVSDSFLKILRRKMAKVGQHVRLPTPYEILDVYLKSEYQQVHEWKSVDVLSIRSRDANFYYRLLDEVVEEIREKCIVQIVIDNEAALKVVEKRLMEKRKHLY
ncbi:uncharacterized protein LOC111274118 [Durio zibethinus]|uniref:Uncharacterized protein LOC111274118 n=1 Tax=Durio zibethinus TaxID=66656 RepID=A0A6P5WEN6_DURZI|nr:uncharacterized protein LOC111274118 [Durio zibethinus]